MKISELKNMFSDNPGIRKDFSELWDMWPYKKAICGCRSDSDFDYVYNVIVRVFLNEDLTLEKNSSNIDHLTRIKKMIMQMAYIKYGDSYNWAKNSRFEAEGIEYNKQQQENNLKDAVIIKFINRIDPDNFMIDNYKNIIRAIRESRVYEIIVNDKDDKLSIYDFYTKVEALILEDLKNDKIDGKEYCVICALSNKLYGRKFDWIYKNGMKYKYINKILYKNNEE